MANPEHLTILRQGVKAWNDWRGKNPKIQIDLSNVSLTEIFLAKASFTRANLRRANFCNANLSHVQLSWVDLDHANLRGSNLTNAVLRRATLVRADLRNSDLTTADLTETVLSGSNLTGANLDSVNLTRANLVEAVFFGADLRRADLYQADFRQADLRGITLGSTVFADTDLSSVTGLELCRHVTPSTLGIDTFFRAKGTIPDIFLRGCGVPDVFIAYAKSLVDSGIEFYSCFISYSTKDQGFAERLHADLQAKGVRCWFAPHDVQGGRKLHEQIDEAIRLHDKLLLILSPHSMESEWVKTEISKARKREVRDKARVLFPISLAPFEAIRDWEAFDADTGKDSAREIREYFIPDFSRWKNHDLYQKSFDRLMQDLRAKQPVK